MEVVGIAWVLLYSLQLVFPGVHILWGHPEGQRSPLDASVRVRVLTEGSALCTICISVDFPSSLPHLVTSWSVLREELAGHEQITLCDHPSGHFVEGLEDIWGFHGNPAIDQSALLLLGVLFEGSRETSRM